MLRPKLPPPSEAQVTAVIEAWNLAARHLAEKGFSAEKIVDAMLAACVSIGRRATDRAQIARLAQHLAEHADDEASRH